MRKTRRERTRPWSCERWSSAWTGGEDRGEDGAIEVVEEVQRREEREDRRRAPDHGCGRLRVSGDRARTRLELPPANLAPFLDTRSPGPITRRRAMPKDVTPTPKKADPTRMARADEESPPRRATAETMATRQRDISVSEFFTKNRHLLGFDNPAKALLTTVKEAVDNSLDACEEAGILPGRSIVEIVEELARDDRFRVVVEDNGPGIVKPQIPKIFAKLLYGSKFHRLEAVARAAGHRHQRRGLYGAAHDRASRSSITSRRRARGRPALRDRAPHRHASATSRTSSRTRADRAGTTDHGTRVEIELVAAYRGGRTGVEAYLEQTVVANPHLALTYRPPKGEPHRSSRASRRAAARGAGDQAAPARRRARDAPQRCCSDSPGKTREGGPGRRLLARLAAQSAEEICKAAQGAPRRSRRPTIARRRASSGCTRRSAR